MSAEATTSALLRCHCIALLLASIVSQAAGAQEPAAPDTALALPSVVVTADRVPGILGTHTTTVTRLTAETLLRLPIPRLTDGLRTIPGLIVVNAGAMGEQPRLIMRGFYGGGETDYAAVLMDGVPLTTLAAGLANWDVIPIAAVRAIEVVRGSSSALYGDAALGGVVNILTIADGPAPARWLIAGGERGSVDGSVAWNGSRSDRSGSLFGGYRRSSGFRAHEEGSATSLGGSVDLHRSERGALSLSALHHRRVQQDPGPLPESVLDISPRASLPFYRFDQNAEQLRRVSFRGSVQLNDAASFSGHLTGESLGADLIRTLQLAPDFADTRSRKTSSRRLVSTAQVATAWGARWPQRFVVGTDASFGDLRSEYRPLLMGDLSAYAAPPIRAGDADARGDGNREALGAFAHWENIFSRLRLVVGGRMDWIRDVYETDLPTGEPRRTSSHQAFSPKLGLNYNYLESATSTGHVYMSVGRSFKAPTLDQLFDQRPIPIPVPPYSVTISNPELRPQTGSAVEAGVSHRSAIGGGRVLDMTLAAYRQQMRDELDFDIGLFRYVNVGRSRHEGLELGVRADALPGTTAFASFTRQNVIVVGGTNAGRQLKAVPRQALSAGMSAGSSVVQASFTVSDVRGAFLDDTNERRLPAYTRVDTRLSATRASFRIYVDVLNALDRKLVSTGFPDPAGTDVVYYHPAARRILQIGVGSTW